jgi:hypothetical protein
MMGTATALNILDGVGGYRSGLYTKDSFNKRLTVCQMLSAFYDVG